jgi:hypothetical protein
MDKIAEIINTICSYYSTDRESISIKTRKREISQARHTCYYFLKKHKKKLNTSLRLIGYEFEQSHSNVLSGIKNIKNLIETNAKINSEIKELSKEIDDIFIPIKSVKRRFKKDKMYKLIELWADVETMEDFKEWYELNEDIEL